MSDLRDSTLKSIMSDLNFLTREEAKLLKTTHTSRAQKAKISGTIPVSLWLLLEAYSVQQSRFRSSVIAEGLELFFSALPPDELKQLHKIIQEQLENEINALKQEKPAQTESTK